MLIMIETFNTSPPFCMSTWFVNIPQGMTSSMQVKKQRKVCVEKNYAHFNGRGRIRTHGYCKMKAFDGLEP